MTLNNLFTLDSSSEELALLIRKYSSSRDIIGRELLAGYVSHALYLLEQKTDNGKRTTENVLSLLKQKTENGQRKTENVLSLLEQKTDNGKRTTENVLPLLAELTELRRKKIIRIPAWVDTELEDAVNTALASGTCRDSQLPIAMLTLEMLNGDTSLTDKAAEIINRCYSLAFDDTAPLGERIDSLHTAVLCCDYVTGYSPLKAATCWNTLATHLLPLPDNGKRTTETRQRKTENGQRKTENVLTLKDTALELQDFVPLSPHLLTLLSAIPSYVHILPRPSAN